VGRGEGDGRGWDLDERDRGRLGINWRTAAKLVEASEPPSYSRSPAGSMLDPVLKS
jgi:hypothetical protein